ncbi:hypothetical protein KZX46_11360 [Polymorphobacter sp. PAMC 29334]|uniref:DUF6491 family protein n=1 Tax=Polymorphobacter sp. PAMC 29334 TaxID=2862331 RepID=UPI001C7211A4|nr:DUF6491 family protein [Polymorphobacter sp. PAMC 29334]QYE36460.1 hypothetical protein KZX46_11360 [Polymorphobacter sp. PAMC 29334]
MFLRVLYVTLGVAALGVSAEASQPAHAARARAQADHDNAAAKAAVRAAKTRCIGVDHVAGAVVFGDRAVELSMNGGTRWRMTFAQACPALSFYQGFYYRRAVAGQLCAGRDAVIARSGGECPIDTIVKVAAARR